MFKRMKKKWNLGGFRYEYAPFVKRLLIMKAVMIFCFFVFIGTSFASDAIAQTTKLSLNADQLSVKEVIEEIERLTGLSFVYDNTVFDVNRQVSFEAKDESVQDIMERLVSGQNLQFEKVNRFIVVTKDEAKSTDKQNQSTKSVSGLIKDSSGNALPGVTVVEKGTTNGAISDNNGEYILRGLAENSTLVFSFIGMRTVEKQVIGRNTIDIEMIEETFGLEEIVAIGYGTMKKTDVTSAVSSVKSEDFVKGSVKDIGQLIQGKVAGLTITSSSGDPVSNTQIQLRGNTTLFGTSSNPLILIDGIPGDFNSVAPEDIESIDVLKDGSAAAIYGTRGTNGVIIITTRRASGKFDATVEYSGYTHTQTIARQLDMLTADDYRQQIADGIRDASDDLGATTNWLDEITHTPISHVHNLTIRGGNMNTNYLASVNYNGTQGIFLKSDKQTFTARTDINHSMFDGLIKVNLGILSRNVNYTATQDGASFNGYTYRQAIIYNPTSPIKDEEGKWIEQVGAFNYDNPLARLDECDGSNNDQWSRINGTVILNPIEGLNFKALLSYSKYNQTRGYYETRNHISTTRSSLNGYASNAGVESIDRLAELTVEYAKTLDEHHFTLLGGYGYQENDWRDFFMRNQDFPTDLFGYNNIGLGTGIKEGGISSGIGSNRARTNLISFFSRLNYSYKNRYLLMASMRYEAASQLYGTKNPWGSFPAISLGWRLSEEGFMKNVDFINELKIRAGYGVTGTQPSSLFLGVATIGYSGSIYSDGKWKQTLAPTRNPNPYLRWEEKQETNIGLDFAIANNRISGTIDYYKRNIDGLLYDYQVPVPPNLVTSTRANVGVMENKGVEVLLNFIPVKNNDFEWSSSIIFSTNSNRLLSLSNELYQATSEYFTTGYTGEPIQTFTHRVDIGDKIGNFYGFKVIDIDEDGRWIYEDKEGNAVPYKKFKHAFEDKHVLGNGLPEFYAGWNNSIRYKNFDFNVTMRGAFGYQILNFERMYLENTMTVQYNRLRTAYDKIFDKTVLANNVNLEYNSYYIEDGDHWKIDNITLGYTIKSDNKVLNGTRLYASTLNSFIFTNYKGIDPEVNRGGLSPGNDGRDKYPTTRTFTLGINMKF
jgi:TonB-dependent starch-binding outer membrane protein SusC